jgi:hypothetical protein
MLHFHTEPPLRLALFRAHKSKTATTLHGRLDSPDWQPFHWLATVYHGLAPDVCPFNPGPSGGYFGFPGLRLGIRTLAARHTTGPPRWKWYCEPA